jgi:hypothetical protein
MARLRELAMHFGIAATEESPPAQPAPPARATPPSPAISTNRAASAQPFPGDFPFRQIPRLGHLDVSPGVSPDRCVSYFLSLVNASQSRHSRGHIWPDLATRARSRRRPSVPCQGVWLSGSVPGRLAGVDLLCVALTHSGQASVQTNVQTKFSRTSAHLLPTRRGGANHRANQLAEVHRPPRMVGARECGRVLFQTQKETLRAHPMHVRPHSMRTSSETGTAFSGRRPARVANYGGV